MERHELTELHYITPIANVPSILERGFCPIIAPSVCNMNRWPCMRFKTEGLQ